MSSTSIVATTCSSCPRASSWPSARSAPSFESGSDVIHQIYVYGNSARSYLLAVVVPNMDVVEARLGTDADEAELKALIRSELKQVGRGRRTSSRSRCRATSSSRWSRSAMRTGCCRAFTSVCGPNLQRKYGERLEQLYAELERKQNDELIALQDPTAT